MKSQYLLFINFLLFVVAHEVIHDRQCNGLKDQDLISCLILVFILHLAC